MRHSVQRFVVALRGLFYADCGAFSGCPSVRAGIVLCVSRFCAHLGRGIMPHPTDPSPLEWGLIDKPILATWDVISFTL